MTQSQARLSIPAELIHRWAEQQRQRTDFSDAAHKLFIIFFRLWLGILTIYWLLRLCSWGQAYLVVGPCVLGGTLPLLNLSCIQDDLCGLPRWSKFPYGFPNFTYPGTLSMDHQPGVIHACKWSEMLQISECLWYHSSMRHRLNILPVQC